MRKQVYIAVCVLVLFSMLASACAPAATPTPAAAPTSAAAKATTAPAKVWKMAALFPGVITDADYNTLGYLGLTEVKATLGVETAYSESVAVPDIDRAMREYVDQGYNIIWTHGSQFLNQTIDLAKQMPNVVFISEGDSEVKDTPANFWMIDRNFHLGYYAIGAIAAKSTKSGKIGYIGGQTLPFSYAEVHAMQQAIKDLGAKVELKTVWTGDFNDPTKGRQYADAMIADGVDVIVCSLNLGIFGVFEAAKAKGEGNVLVTAKYIDKTNFAPKNYITSLIYDFKGPMTDIVKRIQKGDKGAYYPLGFATGVAVQMPLLNVSKDIQPDIQKLVDDVKSGKITVVKNTDKVQ
jgi:basic membrane protein A and related proteins